MNPALAGGLRDRCCRAADEISFWALASIFFFITWTTAGTNVAIGFSIFFFILKKTFSGKWRFESAGDNIFVPLFVLVAVLSVTQSGNLQANLRGLERLIKCFFLYLAACEALSSKRRYGQLIWMIVFSVAVVSADGLVQWARGVDFLRHQAIQPSGALEGVGADFRRIRASFSNCQSFAIYLVTVLPLLATLLRHGKMETRRTVILGLVSLVALSSFILTYSRGGAVAFLVSILFLVILKKDRLLLLALGGLIVIVPLIVARTPLEWALSRPNPLAFLYDSSRLLHWQTALNMIKAHPFLGVGINNFPVNYALYKTAGDTFGVWYAHNAYLQLTAETGIIGFCLFLALIGQVFARGWQALAMLRENQKSAAIALGFLASWVGYLTIGFWESHLQYSDMAVIFWLVAAMVTRLKTLAPQTNP